MHGVVGNVMFFLVQSDHRLLGEQVFVSEFCVVLCEKSIKMSMIFERVLSGLLKGIGLVFKL